MIQTGFIPSAHDGLVTDASYDYYGLHLATCSLDKRCAGHTHLPREYLVNVVFRRIIVWHLDEKNTTWNVEDEWKVRHL
jgi:nucleoporin SEH1